MAGEKSVTLSNQYLALLLNATPIANIADNAASGPLTQTYCALHTADPTSAGNQTTSEVSYAGYARVAVARSVGGWSVSGGVASPVANVIFPLPTGSPTAVATFFSVGSASSGTGILFYAGPLSPTITVTAGLPPTLTTATTVSEG